MFIGEVAKKTGLSVKAIRFYEEKGLIHTPNRQGRYRVYTDADIEVLELISEAKKLGVTLAKLKGVIVYRNGEVDWGRIKKFLEEVKHELENELSLLSSNVQRIENCIKSIDVCPRTLDSPPKGRA